MAMLRSGSTSVLWQLAVAALAYMDDMSLWGSRESLSPAFAFYRAALAEGGLKLEQEKCQLLADRPIPGIDVQAGRSITALGCQLHADFEIVIGSDPISPA